MWCNFVSVFTNLSSNIPVARSATLLNKYSDTPILKNLYKRLLLKRYPDNCSPRKIALRLGLVLGLGGNFSRRQFSPSENTFVFFKNIFNCLFSSIKNEKKQNSIEITKTYAGRKNCNKIKQIRATAVKFFEKYWFRFFSVVFFKQNASSNRVTVTEL